MSEARIQTNHIACAILVWTFIKKAHLMGKTIYNRSPPHPKIRSHPFPQVIPQDTRQLG
ncbi:hypothetical protein QUB68_03520 [Microcoleus sp. A006_D1]